MRFDFYHQINSAQKPLQKRKQEILPILPIIKKTKKKKKPRLCKFKPALTSVLIVLIRKVTFARSAKFSYSYPLHQKQTLFQ